MQKSRQKSKLAPRRRRMRPALAVVLLTLTAGACTPLVETRGYDLDAEALESMTLHESTYDDVLRTFGSPSSIATFRNDIWYYVAERTETTAFFAPDVVYRRVIAFDFDDNGVLENIATLTEEDGKKLQMVTRITPTVGNNINLFQEIFGNIGRFVDDEQ